MKGYVFGLLALTFLEHNDEFFKQRYLDWAAIYDGRVEFYFRPVHIFNRAVRWCRYLQQYGDADQLKFRLCVAPTSRTSSTPCLIPFLPLWRRIGRIFFAFTFI